MQGTDYFRREDRFWTDQDFPEARVVCQRIEAELKPNGGYSMRDVVNRVEAAQEVVRQTLVAQEE